MRDEHQSRVGSERLDLRFRTLNELRCRHAIRTTEYDTSDVGDARRPDGRSLRMGEAATVHRPFPGEISVGPDPLLQVLPELVISIR